MKSQTIDGIKFRRLVKRLGLPEYRVIGILEALWLATKKNAPQGDIGRFSDAEICECFGWDGDASGLIQILVEEGWIDRCKSHRLVIHDWQEHADQGVKKLLLNKKLAFIIPVPLDKEGIKHIQPDIHMGNQVDLPTIPILTSPHHTSPHQEEARERAIPPDPSDNEPFGEGTAAFEVHWQFIERWNLSAVKSPGKEVFRRTAEARWGEALALDVCTLADVRRLFGKGGFLDSDDFTRANVAPKVCDVSAMFGFKGNGGALRGWIDRLRASPGNERTSTRPGAYPSAKKGVDASYDLAADLAAVKGRHG